MNRADFIAEESVNLTFDDIPAEVVQKAKLQIIDQLGCQLAFAELPWGQAAHKYALNRRSQGVSTVVKYGEKIAPEDAAFANSVFGHGFEMDDSDVWTASHPGACMVPTVLALGEDLHSSGKDALTAMVAGYEVLLRIGRLGKTMYKRFWHGTSVPGGFGVAVAAGKLLGFDQPLMKNALGVASSEVCGNTEYMASGGNVKRTLPAMAVTAGIRSAYLAQLGITGPEEPMDGKANVFIGTCDDEPLYGELEVPFKGNFYTFGVGNKPYCCCQGSHALIDCAARIREQIGGDYQHIKKMTIVFHEREVEILCNIVHPKTIIEAQFSARFAISLRMVKGGNSYYDYNEENLNSAEIAALIDKCEIQSVPFGTLSDANGPGRLIVEMEDGSVYDETAPYALGSAKVPMSAEEIIAKFNSMVGPVIPKEQADAIVETVLHLDELEDVSELTKLLVVK